MGRRKKRRRKVLRPRRTLPTVFVCPHCGSRMLFINIRRSKGVAVARCGHCGFKTELPVTPLHQPVDVYGKILDEYNAGTLDFEIVEIGEEQAEELWAGGEEE